MREIKIDANGLHYRNLNEKIRNLIEEGYRKIIIENVYGQRFIGAGLKGDVEIVINGVPGNDLGCFMDGSTIYINGNAQDGVGNTMNSGKIIINGNSGDITGHSMRGGEIYIKGDAGYRVGIHMKEYKNFYPVIVIGGTAKDFLGEYMAGGLIIVLNIEEKNNIVGELTGTGMHGGEIYIRGEIDEMILGKEVKIFNVEEIEKIKKYIVNFSNFFNIRDKKILEGRFIKLIPVSKRPYGKIYSY
jgi:glutamate synthase domain-containing protein 3